MNWIPSAVWLGLLILFAVAEAVTVALVSIWFAAGAMVALLATIFTDHIWTQILLFVIVSAVTMAVVRPLAKKYVFPHRVPTNADRVIGREGVISETVDNLSSAGVVIVAGMAWTARSDSGETIPKGTVVTVKRIDGVKLYVAPVQERKE